MKEVIMKDWTIANNRIYGRVYGHSRFKDGANVVTSNIENIQELDGHKIVHTRNTVYRLNEEDKGNR